MANPVNLRDYQIRVLNDVVEHGRSGRRRVLICLPTGAGKTTVAGAFAQRAIAKGRRVLAVCHRRELVEQMARRFADMTGEPVSIVQAGRRDPAPEARLCVASVQTLLARDKYPPADIVIPDEAHHYPAEQWRKALDVYGGSFLLGLSATPSRADGKPLGDVFEAIVAGPQPSELIAAGHLVPVEVVTPPEALKALAQSPAEALLKIAPGRRTVVFAASREQSKEVVAQLLNAGTPAAHVDMATHPKNRSRILTRFAQGEIQVVSNVGILTEGFDCPAAEVCVLARPVGSLSLYLQMVGRVLRPFPGKGSALLIDLPGAVYLFGPPDVDRTYELSGSEGVKGGKFDLSERTCPRCGALRPRGQKCPLCAAPAGPGAAEPEVVNAELRYTRRLRRDPAACEAYVRLLIEAENKGQPRKWASEKYWRMYGVFPEGTWGAMFDRWRAGGWTEGEAPEMWPASLGSRCA